ncbi:hypothetical protein CLOSTASPAR_00919 [[Clostridium] asparagiforme DSM 15981]|uniref:Uncharacterized protein n=1 Tax=[Clostridium] asparagiforme DSM 15981 TaxID=518636 RepID=C0CVB6_9FIRM|nr:hypothetical protein CLOSTASPAR_00919 [[Clostridium] asparagiforme DSM 15981]
MVNADAALAQDTLIHNQFLSAAVADYCVQLPVPIVLSHGLPSPFSILHPSALPFPQIRKGRPLSRRLSGEACITKNREECLIPLHYIRKTCRI